MKKFVLVAVLWALACGAKPERRLTQEELRMVATAQSLTEWGIEGLDARAQVIEAIPSMDGSLRIRCKYDSERIPGAARDLFSVSSAHFFPTEIAAKEAFRQSPSDYRKGVSEVPGRSVREAPELLSLGDERYSAYLLNGKNIVGNIFVIRRGRVVHSLIFSRLYFDTAGDVHRLFVPMLEAAKKFENS